MSAKRRFLCLLCIAALQLGAASCAGLEGGGQNDPEPPSQLARMLEAQASLPEASVAALQDLRLVAAVQLTYFSEKGGYVSPAKLREGGYLDPEWPRTPAASYRVSCEVMHEGAAFVCFADALEPELDWFMTDSTQTVRWAGAARPTARSPVFGVSEEE